MLVKFRDTQNYVILVARNVKVHFSLAQPGGCINCIEIEPATAE